MKTSKIVNKISYNRFTSQAGQLTPSTGKMMTDLSVPNTFIEQADNTIPVDLSLTAENLEMGDWYTYLYMEQEAHKLAHQDYHVALNTQCVVCHSLFSTKTIAREHFDDHHGGQLFECRFCRLTFVLECNLQQHNELHHSIKLNNCSGILPEKGLKASPLEEIVESLIDDAVDTTLKRNNGILNQKGMSLEEIDCNNNCVNEMEFNVTVTNEQMNASETTRGNEDRAPNDQCENEPVISTVVTEERELKFKENQLKMAGKESKHCGNIHYRSLYIQRHSKNLKKLKDVILKRSSAERRDTISIGLQGENGKTGKNTQNTNVAQTGIKETILESIKTTDRNANKLEQDERGTEPSTFGSRSVATIEVGIKSQKTPNDDKILTKKQIENEHPENKKENVTVESTPSPETISADAFVRQGTKGPLDKDMVKDSTVSRESNSEDGRLWCIHCNISFKTTQTLRKHTLYSLFHKMNTNEEPLEREICYDCASTFANKKNLLKHKRLTCYFRNKNRETSHQIHLPEVCDVDRNVHFTETPEKPTSDTKTSAWKLIEMNKIKDEPCKRNKRQNNTSVQPTNSVENLAKWDKNPPCGKNSDHDNTHIQNNDRTAKNIVDYIPKANVTEGQVSGSKPSHETLHDSLLIGQSVIMIEDRKQTVQNHIGLPTEAVPEYYEKGVMDFNADTTIEPGTSSFDDSTITLDSNLSIKLSGIAGQTKTTNKKQKYTPTACDGCGSTFSSRKSCKRHILNSCPFYRRVRKLNPENNEQVIKIVDPRKSTKRPSCGIASASAEKMPKLQITCKDCGKRFSHKSKYRKHARKHRDLPKLLSEFSKEASLANMPSIKGHDTLVTKQNDSCNKASVILKKIFQCSKCCRYFLTEYALKIHWERFCCSNKIHCPASTPSFIVPKNANSLFEYSKFHVTVKCCICLKLFATRTECYRHLSTTHRLSRRKAIALEREYLGQQIRLNYDLMMNKKRSSVSGANIIPAVNLGLRWKLEAIDFSDAALGINPYNLNRQGLV
ncbi:hypothetical protein LOTGIDRAFT_154793 [Lottia gigantea]|uniref:C2H2-type domain-containing protein n=1 Tax=Lottia gigantea TaxID=225164 RepID=V4A1W7_LOTGI|nr:hypothetical protein LOTGIDRAFT_154793 [Lottia gigantea]ESO87296.1 hypothetical protein LOTGIDRAFT_154793 [Lottia gigantea]